MALSPFGAVIETGSSAVATRTSRRRTSLSGPPLAGSLGGAVAAGVGAAVVGAASDDGFDLPEQAARSRTATVAAARRETDRGLEGLMAAILAAGGEFRAAGRSSGQRCWGPEGCGGADRSEEHTSELQSRGH